ncbi:MAG: D-alanine-D-alanine ligase [Parcubacteria group bacterium GW2011_GWA2_47_21]|nr:MAG: D-alanine-D-alanine ligase [Parcubacteria group bacterium GW2011_GWA2_47_21]
MPSSSGKIIVSVLRGGPSSEYDVSLQTGQTVLNSLPRDKYEPIDVFISKKGEWHVGGLAKHPGKIIESSDVIFNALHGEFGEDGGVQDILDPYQVPYTGSGKVASALAMNKALTKNYLARAGVKMPAHLIFKKAETVPLKAGRAVFQSFAPPYVVKPVNLGSSVGVYMVKTVGDLPEVLENSFKTSPEVLVEEFIMGKEATCGVIDDFRGEKIYPLLPIEIVPPKTNRFYDYNAKYLSNDTEYRLPGNWGRKESEKIQEVAKLAHDLLGLRHYSRSDFIVSRHGVYFLEVNTLPGLTSHSLVPKSLEAIGCPLPVFLDHLLTLALSRRSH